MAYWNKCRTLGWHSIIGSSGFTSVLNGALSKMYHYSGIVFRGYSEEDLDFFLEDYEVGNVREFRGFTSTTKERELAFYGNVLFIIQARSAPYEDRFPDVEKFSAVPEEKEVLFPAGTRFKVRAVERVEESVVIELEQVP
jgi:NAD:arginine ADP-ribosyltransferase